VFDFRYHAVSLVAVLVALVAGVLLGVAIGDAGLVSSAEKSVRESLRGDVDSAREQRRETQRNLDAERRYSTAAYPLPLPPMPFDNFSTNAYGLSKSGMIYMTKMMSRQAGQDGVRVNAIAPGVTMSEATKKIVPDFAIKGLKAGSPMGMTLEPDDLTGTAV